MERPTFEQESRSWPGALTRVPAPVLALCVALLSLTVMYVELPGRPLVLHSVQKLGHPVVFGLVTIALFSIRRQRRPGAGLAGDYLPTFALAMLLGFATELSQVVTHRDPAMRDVALDARGILCALALLLSFDPRLANARQPGRVRQFLRVLVGLIALTTLAPLAWVSSAYVSRALTVPVLFAPRSELDLLLVSLTDTSPELAKLPSAFAIRPDEKALRIPLTSRPYAGVSLDEPAPDWRGYRTLRMEVINPTRSELPLHIRIQDRLHDGNLTDRFEGTQLLPPATRRTIEIPLRDIASAPKSRRLDLEQISDRKSVV